MKKANLSQLTYELNKVDLNEFAIKEIIKSIQLPNGCTISEEREIVSEHLLKLKKAIQSTFINS